MKIDPSKKYNLRNGEIVDDLVRKWYAWNSKKLGLSWYENGKYHADTDSMLDIVSEYVEQPQPSLWWESLKKGDKFKYANNVETVDDIITYKFSGAVIICRGEYKFSVNHCTPYIEPKPFSAECEEWFGEVDLISSDCRSKIESMIAKLREYEKGK